MSKTLTDIELDLAKAKTLDAIVTAMLELVAYLRRKEETR